MFGADLVLIMPKKFLIPLKYMLLVVVASLGTIKSVEALGNIDSISKWAWGTNIGWLNFNTTNAGVTVCADHLEGYIWAENVGWIRVGTVSGCGLHTYSNTTSSDYGVNYDLMGNLTGYAWATNIGWIDFHPTSGGVTINRISGSFDGYAWGENVGWIHFKNTTGNLYSVFEHLFRDLFPVIFR